jgi:hypothetical protein
MKRVVAISLVAIVLTWATPSAQACHHVCCAPCCVTMVEKTVTCYRPEWQERDVTCTVYKAIPREVVEKRTCTVMVPVITPQQRTIYICKYIPREVEREVTCCRMVPVCVTDPCTACTYTTCKPEYYTQKVRTCVMEAAHEARQVTVNVCSYRPEERTFECRRIVCEYQPQTVTCKQRYCVMVPYTAKVMVPAGCP